MACLFSVCFCELNYTLSYYNVLKYFQLSNLILLYYNLYIKDSKSCVVNVSRPGAILPLSRTAIF